MTLRVYLASDWHNRRAMRELRDRLTAAGIECVSRWIDTPDDVPDCASEEVCAESIRVNDEDVTRANWFVMVNRDGAPGGERFAEFARALDRGLKIVWVGRRILSTYCDGVAVVKDVDAAVRRLEIVHRLIYAGKPIDRLADERREFRERAEKAEKERDEARATLERVSSEYRVIAQERDDLQRRLEASVPAERVHRIVHTLAEALGTRDAHAERSAVAKWLRSCGLREMDRDDLTEVIETNGEQ
jgi:hypothetical protein